MRWGGMAAAIPLPLPETATLDDPSPVLSWLHTVRREGGVPHLFAFASSALRLCQVAEARGTGLTGVQFTVTGEPLTAPRLASIQRSGAVALPRYAMTESGVVGFGCLAPSAPDEVHVPHDLHGLVQPGDVTIPGVPSRGLFLTSLRPTAPVVLLNVSMGDQADMTERQCGCSLQQLGWTTHLQGIRSYEKLTAGGMTFLDGDIIRILEEVLPRRFGGGPTDYQLVEEERDDGRPALRLCVHPQVGPVDPEAITEAFLSGIGHGSGAERIMSLVWRDGQFLRVERRPPLSTPSGKILHLHVVRPSSP